MQPIYKTITNTPKFYYTGAHPEYFENESPQIDIFQQKNTRKTYNDFERLPNKRQLPPGLICGKCKGKTDYLTTPTEQDDFIQLCKPCYTTYPHGERMCVRNKSYGSDLVQFRRQRTPPKTGDPFLCSRSSNGNPIPTTAMTTLKEFANNTSFAIHILAT
jgi:hypothetical protein